MYKLLLKWVNSLVLLSSILIIIVLSIETLSVNVVVNDRFVVWFQFGICCVFFLDFLVRLFSDDKKLSSKIFNFSLLVISIPYLSIIDWMHVDISQETHLLLRTIPLIRGVYGLVITISWLTSNKIYNLFFSYLITLIGITYYSSIMFFAVEKNINPMVKEYWNAVWWACMDVTTVGSNIYGVSFLGQLLSAFLAGAGMMLFPIFTAYITTLYAQKWSPKNQQQ